MRVPNWLVWTILILAVWGVVITVAICIILGVAFMLEWLKW